MVNATSGLFEVEEPTRARPTQAVPTPQVQGSEDDLTQVAGAALWGPWLDRLDLVGVADADALEEAAEENCEALEEALENAEDTEAYDHPATEAEETDDTDEDETDEDDTEEVESED